MQKTYRATRRDNGATFSAVVIVTPDLDFACECVTRHADDSLSSRVIHEAEFSAATLGSAPGVGDRYCRAMLDSAIHRWTVENKESINV